MIDGLYLRLVEAGRLHGLGRKRSRLRKHLIAGAGIEQDHLTLYAYSRHGEGDGHELVRQTAGLKCRFRRIDRLLRESGPNELQWPIEPERRRGASS
jgi:hypothetical protein